MDSYTFSVLSNGLISFKSGIFTYMSELFITKKHTYLIFGTKLENLIPQNID